MRWIVRYPAVSTSGLCVTIALATLLATAVIKQYYIDWYLHGRPAHIEITENRHEVQLQSTKGDILHTWTARAPGWIKFAELVERPADSGSEQLAVIGFHQACDSPYAGAIYAFDTAGDLDDAVWECRVEPNEPLPDPHGRGYVAKQFGPAGCRIIDVFSERPGPELVVDFTHYFYSQRIIRIYDLRGELLYQVWQDGGVWSCHWMADARLLVYAGADATLYWDAEKLHAAKPDPLVVFAIRPTLGHIAQDYVRWLSRGKDDETLAWYRYLFQGSEMVDMMDGWELSVTSSFGIRDPGKSVHVCFDKDVGAADGTGCSWTVDESGNEFLCKNENGDNIPCPRVIGDEYHLNRATYDEGDPRRLPDPDTFHLRDMSALPPSTQPAANNQ